MSGKLSEVQGRIGTVHQLEAVITAMRGSAAARSREARSRLDGIRAYAATIGAAIGQALALAPEPDPQPRKPQSPERHVIIVLSSEQGFAGTFNERVLDAAERHLKAEGSELLIVGDRGAMVAAERGVVFDWSAPMVAHAQEVPLLANRITDALYSRLEKDQASSVTVIHAVPGPSASIEVVERTLLPFDFARFKVVPRSIPPITTLPPEQLLAELAEEYVYAELCEEVMLSFAAENEARMQAMIAARSNVSRKLDELVASFRRLRQEEITGEIIPPAAYRPWRSTLDESGEQLLVVERASREEHMKASDVMTRDVVSVAPDTSVRKIAALLLSKGISAVPVVDGAGAPLGIVSEGDLIGRKEAKCEERQDWWLTILAEGEELNRKLLANFNYPRASDLMSAPVITVNEETSLRDIADILTSRRIKRVPVVRDGRIVGIVSRADLVRALVAPPRLMPV